MFIDIFPEHLDKRDYIVDIHDFIDLEDRSVAEEIKSASNIFSMDSKTIEIIPKDIFLLFCSYSEKSNLNRMRYICELRFEYPLGHVLFNEKKFTKYDRVIDNESNKISIDMCVIKEKIFRNETLFDELIITGTDQGQIRVYS